MLFRSDDDIVVLCELLSNPLTAEVMGFITSEDPRNLCGLAVVACFRHLTTIVRSFTKRISGRKLDFHLSRGGRCQALKVPSTSNTKKITSQ